ncbi:metallophosphoesterase [Streptomyces sp. NPDC048442]|uniref:metallophosphoesterase n=1 Tax=Streptomyces sp. NPDC048442 TaxID=3154823 RepID=UPI00343AB4F9
MPTLVVTNDFHSTVPTGRTLLAAIREHRAKGALVIDAGDFFGGNAFHEFSQGGVEEKLLSGSYDAVVPGNHDFADLLRLREPERFPPVVCANLRPPAAFAGSWSSSMMWQRQNVRIGIIGYLGRQAYDAVPSGERAGFAFVDPTAELIAGERDRLVRDGADVVLGVSHTGFASDVAHQEAGWPLPLVLSGHCHSPWYHWSSQGRHVVKAPETGEGLLRIDFSAVGPPQFGIEPTPTPSSPEAGAFKEDGLGETLAAYERWGKEPIGELASPMPARDDVVRLLAAKAREASGADAFLISLWALRSGLPRKVTRQALLDCVPFDTLLVLVDGGQAAEALAEQARQLGEHPVLSRRPTSRTQPSLATTAYLADRLDLPVRPLSPSRSLRDVLTDLVRES